MPEVGASKAKTNENWATLSPEQKWKARFATWLSPDDVSFESAEVEGAYKARVTRLASAIRLKVPDRVPVAMALDFFPAFHSGMTPEEAMYD